MDNIKIISDIQAGENVKENLQLLYEQNDGLIGMCVRPYMSRPDIEDIRQEAFIALCDAAKSYRQESGAFSSHAIQYIKWAIYRYIEQQTGVYIPHNILNDISRYRHIDGIDRMSNEEICRALHIDGTRLLEIRRAIRSMARISIYAPAGDDESLTLADMIPDTQNDIERIEDNVDRCIISGALSDALDNIGGVPAAVIRLVYCDNMTIKDAGERLNISYSQALACKDRALYALRKERKIKSLYIDTSDSILYKGTLSRYQHSGESVEELYILKRL